MVLWKPFGTRNLTPGTKSPRLNQVTCARRRLSVHLRRYRSDFTGHWDKSNC